MINTYFDGGDYVLPVKTFLDSSLYSYVTFDFTKAHDIYLVHDTAETEDSYFSFFGGSTIYKFLAIDKFQDYFKYNDNQDLIHFTFFMSNKTSTSYRSTLNIFDILGIAGGFASILALIFGIFVNYIVEKMYVYNLNADLYQVDLSKCGNPHGDHVTHNTIMHTSKINPCSTIVDEHTKNEIFQDMNDVLVNTPAIENQNFERTTSRSAKMARMEILKRSMDSMNNRRLYNYTFKDICYNI